MSTNQSSVNKSDIDDRGRKAMGFTPGINSGDMAYGFIETGHTAVEAAAD
jgi:hypothetical protein